MASTWTYSDSPCAGIALRDGAMRVGEEGRGRERVAVPVPAGSRIEDQTVFEIPIRETDPHALVVLIRDQSGYRGGWRLRGAHGAGRWQRLVAARAAHEAVRAYFIDHPEPDYDGWRIGADGHRAVGLGAGQWDGPDRGGCPGCHNAMQPGELEDPALPSRVRTVARGECAQGIAGRMGGGPEYLLVLPSGAAVELKRWGRLYGSPGVIRLENRAGELIASFPEQEARAALAVAAL